MYLSKFSCDLDKMLPLESRGQGSSVFDVVNKEGSIGDSGGVRRWGAAKGHFSQFSEWKHSTVTDVPQQVFMRS